MSYYTKMLSSGDGLGRATWEALHCWDTDFWVH